MHPYDDTQFRHSGLTTITVKEITEYYAIINIT